MEQQSISLEQILSEVSVEENVDEVANYSILIVLFILSVSESCQVFKQMKISHFLRKLKLL